MSKPRFIKSYDYDPKTHEFLIIGVAEYDEFAEDYTVAPNSTLIAPPENIPEFKAACFNTESNQWELLPDYRPKLTTSSHEGGKPYYDPKKYWWAPEQWMTEIGDIPEGMSFEKVEYPGICKTIVNLQNEIREAKQYLADTDYIHGVMLEEPEKSYKYDYVVAERKRVRATIDPLQEKLDNLKEQVVDRYGGEALNHLGEN